MLMINKDRLEASLCRDSFFDFVRRFWGEIIPETPVWNWHIPYLCHELQAVAERVFQRKPKLYDLIINISPGTTKSTLCSVMFPAWCWARDPTLHTICGSYAFPLGMHLSTQCLRVIQSDKWRRLFPEVVLESESKALVVNTKGGWRLTTSTGGSVTGMHGHLIIVDDPINPKEAASDAQLRTANDWLDHTLSTRKIDKAITPTIMIMQRLHQDDPTGHMKNRKGIRHICLPATTEREIRPAKLKKRYIGGLFDPKRLSRKVLKKSSEELGAYAYAGQFLQDPVPAGTAMFLVEELKIERGVPKTVEDIRYWDKAGTANDGSFTVGVLMSKDRSGRYWIKDVIRGQWEAARRERIIRQTAEIDGKRVTVVVEQEPGSGGKESAQATVRNLAGFKVRKDRPVGDKVLRADPFAVQVNEGNVYLKLAEWNKALIEEMRFFPLSKYKDQVDACSGAFAILSGRKILAGALK